jgi:hypothetical protein
LVHCWNCCATSPLTFSSIQICVPSVLSWGAEHDRSRFYLGWSSTFQSMECSLCYTVQATLGQVLCSTVTHLVTVPCHFLLILVRLLMNFGWLTAPFPKELSDSLLVAAAALILNINVDYCCRRCSHLCANEDFYVFLILSDSFNKTGIIIRLIHWKDSGIHQVKALWLA